MPISGSWVNRKPCRSHKCNLEICSAQYEHKTTLIQIKKRRNKQGKETRGYLIRAEQKDQTQIQIQAATLFVGRHSVLSFFNHSQGSPCRAASDGTQFDCPNSRCRFLGANILTFACRQFSCLVIWQIMQCDTRVWIITPHEQIFTTHA